MKYNYYNKVRTISKYYKWPLLLLIVAFLTIGCRKEWLAEKADKNQAIPSTYQDLQALLDYSFLNIRSISLSEIASDMHYTSEVAFAAGTERMKNSYTWSRNRPYLLAIPDWNVNYGQIYTFNIVLDALKTINEADKQTIRNNIRGQALYNRAEIFFRLAQTWAPPYQSSTASVDRSIPLKLEADVSLPSTHATVKQTYDQIINDLKEAVTLLPDVALYKTRASRAAALGILARVYQSMRMYEEAGNYANQALAIEDTLMDYSSLSLTRNFIGNFITNPEVIMHTYTSTDGVNGALSTNCFIDTDFYNSYETNDLRKQIFFKVNPTTNLITFKGNYTNSASQLFNGPATDELYLIRAESYARAGNTLLAMKDLNDLLRTRWAKDINGNTTYVDQTAANPNEALVKILEERKKELVLRNLRWMDLRRLNFEEQFKVTLTRTIGGQTYTLEPGSYRYTFPIPDYILQQTSLQQNPGWSE